MKFTTITNGIEQIVLTPESPMEKMSLSQFVGKKIEVVHFDKPMQILESPVPDSIVFRTIKELTGTTLAEPKKLILIDGIGVYVCSFTEKTDMREIVKKVADYCKNDKHLIKFSNGSEKSMIFDEGSQKLELFIIEEK
jgi:hypothetical protein